MEFVFVIMHLLLVDNNITKYQQDLSIGYDTDNDSFYFTACDVTVH